MAKDVKGSVASSTLSGFVKNTSRSGKVVQVGTGTHSPAQQPKFDPLNHMIEGKNQVLQVDL